MGSQEINLRKNTLEDFDNVEEDDGQAEAEEVQQGPLRQRRRVQGVRAEAERGDAQVQAEDGARAQVLPGGVPQGQGGARPAEAGRRRRGRTLPEEQRRSRGSPSWRGS